MSDLDTAVARIQANAPVVAEQHSNLDAAIKEEKAAQKELLASVWEHVRPALPALTGRDGAAVPLLRGREGRPLKAHQSVVLTQHGIEVRHDRGHRRKGLINTPDAIARLLSADQFAELIVALGDLTEKHAGGRRDKTAARARRRAAQLRAVATLLENP